MRRLLATFAVLTAPALAISASWTAAAWASEVGVATDVVQPVPAVVQPVPVVTPPLAPLPPLPPLPLPLLPLPHLPLPLLSPAPPASAGGGPPAIPPIAASHASPAAAQAAPLDRPVPELARVDNPPVDRPSVVVAPSAAFAAPARSGPAAAARAVGTLGFSLLVAVGVLVFLAVQGWVDRRDPHLARAPIDADDDVLGFA